MGKNILIFSDGTGQAGGLKPDQRLSNVYKLFRASRPGPDSTINPSGQVAFYDAGLGTDRDEGAVPIRAYRHARKFLSAAIGFGISRNIADCYEAILKYYEPGDRIYLFGFSRGAYTARCVAGVMSLCGIPTRTPVTDSCPRYGRDLRAIADEAVSKVYEHGAGRDREKFEAERLEQARRFRGKYGSDHGGSANVVPYFIGVFDTVAALGASGLKKVIMIAGILAAGAMLSAILAKVVNVFTGVDTLYAALAVFFGGGALTLTPLLRSSFKIIRDFPEAGKSRWHFAGWNSGFYDKLLSSRVRYARHALAIDETRLDFARVPWANKGQTAEREAGEPEWLQQIWFAGNHSDIGGSYPEEESRLSDIVLDWMLAQATSLPHPIVVDKTKLNLFPAASGIQHSEVEAVRDFYPRWVPPQWRFTWKEASRWDASGAVLHSSVFDRFALSSVSHYGRLIPYRPKTLSNDSRLGHYY